MVGPRVDTVPTAAAVFVPASRRSSYPQQYHRYTTPNMSTLPAAPPSRTHPCFTITGKTGSIICRRSFAITNSNNNKKVPRQKPPRTRYPAHANNDVLPSFRFVWYSSTVDRCGFATKTYNVAKELHVGCALRGHMSTCQRSCLLFGRPSRPHRHRARHRTQQSQQRWKHQ